MYNSVKLKHEIQYERIKPQRIEISIWINKIIYVDRKILFMIFSSDLQYNVK